MNSYRTRMTLFGLIAVLSLSVCHLQKAPNLVDPPAENLSQEKRRARVQKKMRQVEQLVPQWTAAGGKQETISSFGQQVDLCMKTGKLKEAEEALDRILSIVQKSALPAESELSAPPPAGPRPVAPVSRTLISMMVGLHRNSPPGLAGLRQSMDLLTQNGINGFAFTSTWEEMEPAAGEYRLQEQVVNPLTQLVAGYPQIEGTILVLKLIDTNWRPMPEDIKSKPFDSPEVLGRFEKLIDAIAAEPSAQQIHYLLLGNEIDGYLLQHPGEIGAFTIFYERAIQRIHEKLPNTWVGTVLTFGATKRKRPEIFDPLIKAGDFIAYTYYPVRDLVRGNVSVGWQMRPTSGIAEDLRFLAERTGNKPFAFTEIGYSCSPLNGSSEEQQADFVREMFHALKPYRQKHQLVFLIYHALYGEPASLSVPYAGAQGIDASEEFCAFVKEIGLRSYTTGRARMAWAAFVEGARDLP